MSQVTVSHFHAHLAEEVDKVVGEHQVLRVVRPQGGDFVVVSAEDWEAVGETLHLHRVPGLVESLHAAAQEPLAQGVPLADLKW